jgi:hypothetical protein
MDRKEAIATVAKELDLPKKLVYAAVVEAQAQVKKNLEAN